MQHDFWHERWQSNQIGFHQADINPHLQQHWPALNLPAGSKVFVPLCGKSSDMLWLRQQGHEVIGVELSQLAVEAFFTENGLEPVVEQQGAFSVYQVEGITLYCGDFFALQPHHLQGVAGVFDRASLVALPPEMRADYARHMQQILPPQASVLLVAFDYPQHEMPGPPFSVASHEIEALYGQHYHVQHLHSLDLLEREPRFREKGVSQMLEQVYRLVSFV